MCMAHEEANNDVSARWRVSLDDCAQDGQTVAWTETSTRKASAAMAETQLRACCHNIIRHIHANMLPSCHKLEVSHESALKDMAPTSTSIESPLSTWGGWSYDTFCPPACHHHTRTRCSWSSGDYCFCLEYVHAGARPSARLDHCLDQRILNRLGNFLETRVLLAVPLPESDLC